jgi:hypothetical protein
MKRNRTEEEQQQQPTHTLMDCQDGFHGIMANLGVLEIASLLLVSASLCESVKSYAVQWICERLDKHDVAQLVKQLRAEPSIEAICHMLRLVFVCCPTYGKSQVLWFGVQRCSELRNIFHYDRLAQTCLASLPLVELEYGDMDGRKIIRPLLPESQIHNLKHLYLQRGRTLSQPYFSTDGSILYVARTSTTTGAAPDALLRR